MSKVAALYVETGGVYFGLPDVDPWDEARDARLYAGPWPVVAHPPCARWSRLAGFTEARFGLKRGEDGGCFEAALRSVREFGGVLEHPAYSAAWDRFGLPEPLVYEGWTGGICGGWSCYVEQGRYGLPVKKATWLYAYGVEIRDLEWGFTPDAAGDGPGREGRAEYRRGRRDGYMDAMPDSDRIVPGQERRGRNHMGLHAVSPPAFRDALLAMARTAALTPA